MSVYLLFRNYQYEGQDLLSVHGTAESAQVRKAELEKAEPWLKGDDLYIEERHVQ
jgi:hypothetical protein